MVTYYHWIDGPLDPKVDKEISYWWRQLEAAFTADHLFFNSNYSANQFIDNVENTVNSYDDIRMIVRKCAKIPPPFDMNLIVGTRKDKSNGIVFNHRLSSLPLYRENFNNLIKFVNRLYSENGAEPSIHFMNPRGLKLPNFELFGCNEVYDKDLNTKEYYNYLKSSKVGIAPNFFFNS
ncbi:MAG: DUF3524 domain-containing protein, partial [Bacteroidetes bacterium]|nr:DUF3524 domain-containing protein [Bacteroidota bacterium]